MKRLLALISVSLLLFLQTYKPAFAWGQTGHRAIGYIAENFLSKKAKKRIQALLPGEDLALCSTWMDEIRSDKRYEHTYDWHWVTIPDGMSYEESEKNPKGDILLALEHIIGALKADTLAPPQQTEYLKMLVHLVGDLHQPLHVGKGDDRGGNDLRVRWMGQSSNLHRVWDSDMINSKQLSYTELAQALLYQLDRKKVKQWLQGSIQDWALECVALRQQVYDTGDTDRMGYDYLYRNWDTVQLQLLKAGLRLAYILNDIYG